MHIHTRVPLKPLNADIARDLLETLDVACQIPHAIVREKQKTYGHSRAMSVGKPWYEYENHDVSYVPIHTERRRLRVVERWMGTLHGVVNIGMQYIYMQQLAEAPQGTLVMGDADIEQPKTVRILESPKPDEHYSRLLKLAFLSSGQVVGKLLLRNDSPRPYIGGCADDCAEAVEDFYLEQPLLEEDYRFSTPDDIDLHYVIAEVQDFIAEEQHLADMRTTLGYGCRG